MALADATERALADDWRQRLAYALLTGATEETAMTVCGSGSAPLEEVQREVANTLSQPLYKAARTIAIRLHCREWWLRAVAKLAEMGDEASLVDVRHDLTDIDFLREYYYRNRSVCIPGLASGWPAISRWSPDYLSSVAGTVMVEVMVGRDHVGAREQSTTSVIQRSMLFADYVDCVYSGRNTNDYYMVGRNQFFDKPGTAVFLNDIVRPPYVSLEQPGEHVRLWFGPAGTVTQLHCDDHNILLVQIVGRKTVRLYAPYFSECMEQRRPWFAEVDPQRADAQKQPQAAAAVGTSLELSPGDALFIPVGWWHALEAIDVSMTLTFTGFGVRNEFGAI
jgi:Cupin-like domain